MNYLKNTLGTLALSTIAATSGCDNGRAKAELAQKQAEARAAAMAAFEKKESDRFDTEVADLVSYCKEFETQNPAECTTDPRFSTSYWGLDEDYKIQHTFGEMPFRPMCKDFALGILFDARFSMINNVLIDSHNVDEGETRSASFFIQNPDLCAIEGVPNAVFISYRMFDGDRMNVEVARTCELSDNDLKNFNIRFVECPVSLDHTNRAKKDWIIDFDIHRDATLMELELNNPECEASSKSGCAVDFDL